MSVQEICRVAENTQLGDGLFLMVLHAPKITELAQCGQFVHIACGEGHLLRRPISICAWKAPELRIVFQVKGEGTKWLSERRTGDELDVLGPLGHGFDVGALGSAPVFIGGGIGVPPMLGCVREAVKQGAKPAAILGFRNQSAWAAASARASSVRARSKRRTAKPVTVTSARTVRYSMLRRSSGNG